MNTTNADELIQKKLLDIAPAIREKLRYLKELIYKVAAENPALGSVEESLKWGELSYALKTPNIGTPIRMDVYRHREKSYAIYFHCQTSLIADCKKHYPSLTYEGKRGIIFSVDEPFPEKIIKEIILKALTYKLTKEDNSAEKMERYI